MSHQRLILTDGVHAPAEARAWLAARLPSVPSVSREVLDDALLLVSELVTNAVRHGAPEIELGLLVEGARVRLEVRDGGEKLPVVRSGRPAIDRPTGRGLLIVAATARDWGVVKRADHVGKTVWAELATDDGAGANP